MRRLGSILIGSGVVVGLGVVVAMLGVIPLPVMPWIVSVGLAKLTLLASGGLMGAGAVCNRLALRREQRELLPPAAPRTPVS